MLHKRRENVFLCTHGDKPWGHPQIKAYLRKTAASTTAGERGAT